MNISKHFMNGQTSFCLSNPKQSETKMTNKVVPFNPHRLQQSKDPVAEVCSTAGEAFKRVLILGENQDGQIQMLTTVEDVSEVLWYMEAARFAIMTGAVDEIY
ncbi:hypothetical protein N9X93_01090 [Alphaproteobacteria bacterium]|nr:hypothetical protein [Alphaproteobacteria bacterium]